jgi:hypothetical protein
MAINCDLNTLLAASKCLQETCTAEEERFAIDLLARVTELAAAGGTDYRTNLTKLQNDAKQFQVLFKSQREAIALYIDLQNVVAVSPSFNTEINALKAAAKCYECLGHEWKKNLMLFLKCQLNSLGRPE